MMELIAKIFIGYLVDKNLPGDDKVYSDLADEILSHKPKQGY